MGLATLSPNIFGYKWGVGTNTAIQSTVSTANRECNNTNLDRDQHPTTSVLLMAIPRLITILPTGEQKRDTPIAESTGIADADKVIVTDSTGIVSRSLLPRPQEYVFNTPANQWTVNHNRGYRPGVLVYTLGGQLIECDISHNTVNQAVINFSTSIAGFVQIL
jgi:hypothetical protein